MNKIKLNNTELPIINYNRNTNFNGNSMISTCNIGLSYNDIMTIQELATETITNLSIYVDDEKIYELPNITAKIDSIQEYLADNTMNISINMTF